MGTKSEEKKYTPEYVKKPVYVLHSIAIIKIKKINKETKN